MRRWLAGLALMTAGACDDAGPVADLEDATLDARAADLAVEDAQVVDAELAVDAGALDAGLADAAPIFAPRCDAVPEARIETIDLGEIFVSTGGAFGGIGFTLPDDVISFSIVFVEEVDSALMAVTHLTGPDGEILVSPMPPGYAPSARDQLLGPFPGGFYSPNRSATSATGAGGLLVPNNPGVAIQGGDWQVRFAAVNALTGRPAETRATVKVLVKRAAEAPACGRLPVHLFFTGARGWTAQTAPDDADFQRALDRMRAFYAAVGVTLGPVTYDDVDDPPDEVDATGGPGSAMHDLFATNGYEDGLGIFFVARITSPFGTGVGGVAGGVPGPTLQPGTPRSGVVVATELEEDPDAIGHIMGHESGHFLGLFHTVEFFGETDQIADTPTNTRDQSNLMYPTVTAGEATLSPGQGWVLHKNASVIAEEPR